MTDINLKQNIFVVFETSDLGIRTLTQVFTLLPLFDSLKTNEMKSQDAST